MKFSLTLLALTAATASAAVPSLTPDNYDAMTDGKTVFIKFFAPWYVVILNSSFEPPP